MLTTTSTYAMIAMTTMARNASRLPMTAKELAELGDIPTNYLSKIMRQLVRAELIGGSRGIGGGFRFVRPPSQIKLSEIVDLFEEVERPRVCPFGKGTCNDDDPCNVHKSWGGIRNNFIAVLSRTSLAKAARDTGKVAKRGVAKNSSKKKTAPKKKTRR